MLDQPVLHEKAAAAILSGKLPARRPDSTSGGPGTGAPCAVCDLPVAMSELEHEFEMQGTGGVEKPSLTYAPCPPPVLRGVELIRARAVPRPGTTGLSDDDLRRQIRVRLATGRLPSVEGVSQSHRGTGRPCIVCRRVVERTDVEREVTGRSGVVLTTHEACYKPWREESRVWRDLVAVGESAERSGVMDRT